MIRRTHALLPTPSDLAFICSFVLALWLGQFISNRDGDLGWHLAIGRYILSTHSIPTHDFLSYTMQGQPFVPHEWLAAVLFALSYEAGGFEGVALLTAGVIGLTFAGLTSILLRRGVCLLLALPLVMLGMLASIAHWATRPHIFTFLWTLLWSMALEDHRRAGVYGWEALRRWWWLLPLMLLWVNMHGAFIIGDTLTTTYIAGAALMWLVSGPVVRRQYGRQLRDLGLLLLICLLLSGLNPSGFGLIANNAGFLQQDLLLKNTPEWQSPDFHNPLFYPLLLLLLLALAVSVRREITPLLLLTSWTAFSLYSFRNLVQFIVICLPLLAESAQALLQERAAHIQSDAPAWLMKLTERSRQLVAKLALGTGQLHGGLASILAALIIAGLLLAGVRIDFKHGGYGFSSDIFPIAAIEQLHPFPPGQRVFNDALWGGYFSFCCWPAVRNFADGRIDFYGSDYWHDYQLAIEARPGWQAVLDRYQVDWVMVAADRPLVQWLKRDTGWRQIYVDKTAAVFVRQQTAGGAGMP